MKFWRTCHEKRFHHLSSTFKPVIVNGIPIRLVLEVENACLPHTSFRQLASGHRGNIFLRWNPKIKRSRLSGMQKNFTLSKADLKDKWLM
jgi:hypothetical protein